MNDTSNTAPNISRRNLFGGVALSMLMPQGLSAAQVADRLAGLDIATLHNLLRGMVLLEQFGDPVIDADADGLVAQIAHRLPEARLLMSLYRHHMRRGTLGRWRAEDEGDLAVLHMALSRAQPVSFTYTNLESEITNRRILPLAMLHPAHGIQVLGWCELRSDYRRFFVGSMANLTVERGDFAARRLALVRGLIEHEGIVD